MSIILLRPDNPAPFDHLRFSQKVENEITKRWIEAGKIIAADPDAKIACPVCQKSFLQVIDVRNEKILERHMACKECGAYNAMRMFRPLDSSS